MRDEARYPDRAKQVYRFESQNYKIILQPTLKNQWRPVRMTSKAFFQKLYRLDMECESWDTLFSGEASVGSSDPPKPPGPPSEHIKSDYLHAIFQPQGVFSYPTTRSEIDPNGVVIEKQEEVFLQVISVVSSSARPKRVTTTHEDQDVIATSRIAVNLQYMDVWAHRVDGTATVYLSAEPSFSISTTCCLSHVSPQSCGRGILRFLIVLIASMYQTRASSTHNLIHWGTCLLMSPSRLLETQAGTHVMGLSYTMLNLQRCLTTAILLHMFCISKLSCSCPTCLR